MDHLFLNWSVYFFTTFLLFRHSRYIGQKYCAIDVNCCWMIDCHRGIDHGVDVLRAVIKGFPFGKSRVLFLEPLSTLLNVGVLNSVHSGVGLEHQGL